MAQLTITTDRDRELIGKIKNLKPSTIIGMSYPSLEMLTQGFKQLLVYNLLFRGNTSTVQLAILEKIKKAFRHTRLIPFPYYICELQMNLEIGQLLTPNGFISLSPLEEEENAAPQTSGSPDDMAAKLKELRKENEALKKQLEECRNKKPDTEEMTVELLSNLMFNVEQNARTFLEKIRGLSDAEITDIVAEWVKDNKISKMSCRRDLWRILHAAKLYESTESNYNTAMKNKQ